MRKGQTMSEEQKVKISKAHKGMKKPWVSKKTPEHLKAIATALTGKKYPFKERPKAKGRNVWNKGLKLPFKERLKAKGRPTWNKGLKGYLAGEKNPKWIADRSLLKKFPTRIGQAYAIWKKACKERDNKKCRLSDKECKGMLEVHHIERWIDYPELRYEVSNGITLCHFHHPRTKVKEDNLKELFKKIIAG